MQVAISRTLLDAVHAAALATPGFEICGLLFGSVDRIDSWEQTRNVATQPEHAFEIDPARLLAAVRSERAGGPRLIGYVHSHPSSDSRPSPRDAAMADPDGRLWLIVAGGCAACWRASARGALHGKFDPVALMVNGLLASAEGVGQSDGQ